MGSVLAALLYKDDMNRKTYRCREKETATAAPTSRRKNCHSRTKAAGGKVLRQRLNQAEEIAGRWLIAAAVEREREKGS